MRFREYVHALPWTDKDTWQWPAGDEKLVAVFGQVADTDVILKYVKNRGTCIQAGGACGIWPLRFSQVFDVVYTFEPQAENFACLVANTEDADNIIAYPAPLANDNNPYSIVHDIHELKNWGAGYVQPSRSGTKAMRIDELGLEECDLIQLDVEGYELQALLGAAETIDACRPVIVLEEKRLNHMGGDPARARKWLEAEYGYKQVAAIHRDVILAC